LNKNKPFLSYKLDEWARDITSLANPLILVFIPFVFIKDSATFYHLLIALLINEALGSLIKILFPKKRPNGQSYNTILEKIDAGSFPSLHAARITLVYLTLFSASVFLSHRIIFLSIIVLVILSRVKLKKHFWTDVVGGFLMGGFIWWFF